MSGEHRALLPAGQLAHMRAAEVDPAVGAVQQAIGGLVGFGFAPVHPGAEVEGDPVPVDDQGIDQVGAVAGTWLPATATAMAFLVQQSPVREAAQTAERLGVLPYSVTSFHRVTQALGASYATHQDPIEDALIARYTVPATATGLTLSLDRVAGPFEVPRPRPPGRP